MEENKKIKITTVMASYLSDYEYSAGDRVRKFHRAVNSFINQTYTNAELIVVSDGCEITKQEMLQYENNPNIKLCVSDKQPLFSGVIRNIGCFMATGDVINYLDSDDLLGKNHNTRIAEAFEAHPDLDWVYFDDHIIYLFNPVSNEILATARRDVQLQSGTIGTSSIAHRKTFEINWLDCDGYGHDWTFIKKLIDLNKPNMKIDGGEYYVCHIPNSVDS